MRRHPRRKEVATESSGRLYRSVPGKRPVVALDGGHHFTIHDDGYRVVIARDRDSGVDSSSRLAIGRRGFLFADAARSGLESDEEDSDENPVTTRAFENIGQNEYFSVEGLFIAIRRFRRR
ncbi:hypothetical protein ACFFQF_05275 [Haladaptatus pallidirubidus]|uniref:hypothetical protein n=1 Tax=Haladaptatus pallidirubidus TaxID=1008152 RepID=UPI0035E96D54